VINCIGSHATDEEQDPVNGVMTASQEEFDSWTTANLSYSFDAGDWGQLRIGANNVTDEDPVLDPSEDVPSTPNLYDYTGRVIYIDYRKSWD